MNSLVVKDFDLALSVKSGQLFAYDELGPHEFSIANGGKAFWVKQELKNRNRRNSELLFDGIGKNDLLAFFDLNHDIGGLHRRLAVHKTLLPFLERYRGLRLIRQDPRQAALTFVLSSNNNQKRIKKMLDGLRQRFGQELVVPIDDSRIKHKKNIRNRTIPRKSFPSRGRITCTADLDGLNFGYRCSYLVQTDWMLTPQFLKKVSSLQYPDARAFLQTLPGVGPKVADCILTYSTLRDGRAFPVDVWVKRALKAWYGKDFKRKHFTDKNIQEFARKTFGDDAAYAQQYLFLAAQELLRSQFRTSKSTQSR
jgi:N-glycosylase/DNA lyase